jgi:hypothetical protein
MGYSDLYDFCQDLAPAIKRGLIYDRTLAASGVNTVRHFRAGMDIAACRGFYLSARNTEHPFVKQTGQRVIVTARGLNRCWERFVFVKELMHLFDDPKEAADTGDKFEQLLADFGPGSPTQSVQMESELKCFWRALAALCPEKERLAFQKAKVEGSIDNYAIALKLRIPEQYVPRLFLPNYLQIVQLLTDKKPRVVPVKPRVVPTKPRSSS